MARPDLGRVITARGTIAPDQLGAVMMHEHLHSDCYDWEKQELVGEEKPITAERRDLLVREAWPYLARCAEQGCGTFVDTTPAPWRAWPTFYAETSRATGLHIVLSTGFYREVEDGCYWVKKPEDRIWPFVTNASVDELADYCVSEIVEGIHGTDVRAGAIKLGTSAPAMTDAERKTFIAGAKAQQQTGVHITTHCTKPGAESSQLAILDEHGVDLSRCVIGHTAWHLMDPDCRKTCIDWMRRGANFLPTNLGVPEGDDGSRWQPLVDAFKELFDLGLGDHLVLGLDWAFVSESGPFAACTFMPPPPFLHMFANTLPAFRRMGLTPEMEQAVMVANPGRILPVQ